MGMIESSNYDYSMFNAIILDSNLISSVQNQRFYSGMDCYIHCVESLEGTMINELSKGIADKALSLCTDVFTKGLNNDMLITASYLGGVSIVNSGWYLSCFILWFKFGA